MKILHLYPNLMNLYGDYGNLTVLKRHLEDQGVKVKIEAKEVSESIDFDRYDMIYMGSGTENNLMVALDSLMVYKHYLKKAIENDKVVLFTGNAMELMGKKIDDKEALGLVDFTVETTDRRYTGDVIVHSDVIGDVVGFINRSTLISGGEGNKLFTYEFRSETLKDNDYEGYRYRNLFGTHFIGPVLVKNPCFMRKIVSLLLKGDVKDITYPLEGDAYQTTLTQLKKRK